jgi:hypothetical protein
VGCTLPSKRRAVLSLDDDFSAFYAVWLTWEPDVVPDDAEAILFCNRDIRASGLMVTKFMFSSSWTSS